MERTTCPNCKYTFTESAPAEPIDTSDFSTSWTAWNSRTLIRAWFATGGRWEGWRLSREVYADFQAWIRSAGPEFRHADASHLALSKALVEMGGDRKRLKDGNHYAVAGLDTSALAAEDAVRF